MSYTKHQISNFMNDKILFRFSIDSSYRIEFTSETLFTFDEVERIIESNCEYWKNVATEIPNSFSSIWQNWQDKVSKIRIFLQNAEQLDLSVLQDTLYYDLSGNREMIEQDRMVYVIQIESPIDLDAKFDEISRFVEFYSQRAKDDLVSATKIFISIFKNNRDLGGYFSHSNENHFYPALYILRNYFSTNKEAIEDFETSIVKPLTNRLSKIVKDSDERYGEITEFIDTKHDEIQQQFDIKVDEFKEFKEGINQWQQEATDRLSTLEETYKNKLSLEAPEQLWNNRAEKHQEKARNWTIFLVVSVIILILVSTRLVIVIHDYASNLIKDTPFLSESFILLSVISFFIYIIRVLIKIVMSNHHLSTEYSQKATLTRFYQALTKSGASIDTNEKIIIIQSLFSKVETGLVKTESSNDSEAILALLSRTISKG